MRRLPQQCAVRPCDPYRCPWSMPSSFPPRAWRAGGFRAARVEKARSLTTGTMVSMGKHLAGCGIYIILDTAVHRSVLGGRRAGVRGPGFGRTVRDGSRWKCEPGAVSARFSPCHVQVGPGCRVRVNQHCSAWRAWIRAALIIEGVAPRVQTVWMAIRGCNLPRTGGGSRSRRQQSHYVVLAAQAGRGTWLPFADLSASCGRCRLPGIREAFMTTMHGVHAAAQFSIPS